LKKKLRIALLGGGPSALFMLKRLVESKLPHIEIDIFEKRSQLGVGLPYGQAGAGEEHITNVSGNEIPEIVTPIADWIKTVPMETLEHFHINEKFNDYKVLPRLLFGQYLSDQFDLLITMAKKAGMTVKVHYESTVTDVEDGQPVTIEINKAQKFDLDIAIICTGHYWPQRYEGKVPGYFDSPYPPAKLALKLNHAVAIKGSSLTAVDAVRTLARHHGQFNYEEDKVTFQLEDAYPDFKMVLHTRHGMLPAVRFHLDNSHLENKNTLKPEEIAAHRAANDGFLSLDFIFEKDFKDLFKAKDTAFYAHIKAMSMEEFVNEFMDLRDQSDPFELLKAEYAEAERSIEHERSIYWKEMLGVLSFAMNYPAKHLSAEDMQRLQKVLLPLISIVIAYLPQTSAEELLALHAAGLLAIVEVGEDSEPEANPEGGVTYNGVHFRTFVDAVGQPHLDFEEFPFKSLIANKTISPALLQFRSVEAGKLALAEGKAIVQKNGHYYLHVPGITMNDSFQIVGADDQPNDRIYIMAVPYIGGYNPDYSGLDFCEAASKVIIKSILNHEQAET
jgi:uncharacterized NAD(P)/FAD-binding protein YdhS